MYNIFFNALLSNETNYMALEDRRDIISRCEQNINDFFILISMLEDAGYPQTRLQSNMITRNAEELTKKIFELKLDFNDKLFKAKKKGDGKGISYFDAIPRHKIIPKPPINTLREDKWKHIFKHGKPVDKGFFPIENENTNEDDAMNDTMAGDQIDKPTIEVVPDESENASENSNSTIQHQILAEDEVDALLRGLAGGDYTK